MDNTINIYTDGSYNSTTGYYGCGAVLVSENGRELKRMHKTGCPEDGQNGWNINGEIDAAIMAITAAIQMGYKNITIYHDYEGVGCWPDYKWKATKPYTMEYAYQINQFRQQVDICFIHVKGHSGNKWNTIADEEAKIGANAHSVTETIESVQPTHDDGLNTSCRIAIAHFHKIHNPNFRDYAKLRTEGRDRFSSMPADIIEESIGSAEAQLIRDAVHQEDDYKAALRWRMRGLTAEEAAHKVNVDREVAVNAKKRYSEG